MRVHLAGTGTAALLEINAHAGQPHQYGALNVVKHPWRLVSYLDRKPSLCEFRSLPDPESMIMDSGLFSLMFGASKGEIPPTFDAYRDFARRYLDTLDSMNYRGLLVECDVQRLLGMDATHRLREEFAPLGDRVIYTWHTPEKIDGLIKLAKERSYIALALPELRIVMGGAFTDSSYKSAVWKLLQKIHDSVKPALPPRIHLLGCTVPELMQTNLAWSCDSTSWLAGVRFGRGVIYQPGGKLVWAALRSRAFVKWRDTVLQTIPSAALDQYHAAGKPYVLDELACAYSFAQYQRWLDDKFTPLPVKEYVP